MRAPQRRSFTASSVKANLCSMLAIHVAPRLSAARLNVQLGRVVIVGVELGVSCHEDGRRAGWYCR